CVCVSVYHVQNGYAGVTVAVVANSTDDVGVGVGDTVSLSVRIRSEDGDFSAQPTQQLAVSMGTCEDKGWYRLDTRTDADTFGQCVSKLALSDGVKHGVLAAIVALAVLAFVLSMIRRARVPAWVPVWATSESGMVATQRVPPLQLSAAIMQFADVFTDICFYLDIAVDEELSTEAIMVLTFLLLPVAANCCATVYELYRASQLSTDFREWLKTHAAFASPVLLLGAFNVQSVLLLESKVIPQWNAQFDRKVRDQLQKSFALSTFLEDVPQFALQALILSKTDEYGSSLLLSMFLTVQTGCTHSGRTL
ncbi:MAG: hypothetical protein MHM6MM_006899, partial [Cercozoa sp. M6MM]